MFIITAFYLLLLSLRDVENRLIMPNYAWQVENSSSFYHLQSRLGVSSPHVVVN